MLLEGGCNMNVMSLHTCPLKIIAKSSEKYASYNPLKNVFITNPIA